MNKFIVDPSIINRDEIKNEIQTFVSELPDGLDEFFEGSAGAILTDLLSAHKAYLSIQAIFARREAFLRYAKNKSSIIGFAQFKGYSAFRGTNARIKISFTPIANQTINRFDIVGAVKDVDLIAIETKVLIAGQPTELLCSLGNVVEEEKIANSSAPSVFRFEQPNVSEDIDVFLDDELVIISNRILEAQEGKFVVQTNPVTSVDIFYLNTPDFLVQYVAGSILKIRYITINETQFLASDVAFDLTDDFITEITAPRIEEEDKESIRINAPLFAETQFVIRGRRDYAKVLRLLDTTILDSDYEDISPMVVRLFYVRDDLTLYSPMEKVQKIEELSLFRSAGLEPPTIGEAIENPITVKTVVTVNETTATLVQDILNIVEAFEKKLAIKLDFELIENRIERLSGVRITRVEILPKLINASTPYYVGEFLTDNTRQNIVHRIERIIYRSDVTEPIWPTVIGEQIVDGRVIWECKYFERQCDPLNPELPLIPPRQTWQPNTDYQLNQIVIPTNLDIFEYILVGFINESGMTEPIWPMLNGQTPEELKGARVIDKDFVWLALPQAGNPDIWQANNRYKLGDIVIATDQEDSDTQNVMFQAIAFVGYSDSMLQPFDNSGINIETISNNLQLFSYNKTKSPRTLRPKEFYTITTNIQIEV